MSGQFRLAVVLRLRLLAEDAAKARLGEALASQHRATDALIACVQRELEAHRRVEARQAAVAQAGDLVAAMRGVEAAETATATAREALRAAETIVVEARASLADATRRREVVERLKERLAFQEAVEAQRREDALLSEIAGVRHARALGSEGEG